MIFEYAQYELFIQLLKSKGKCVYFREWDGTNSFLLRFDVDFDLRKALDMALLNQRLDVKSTFFILTTCHFYNPMSIVNRKLLKELAATGAEIGLHFDPTIYPELNDDQLEEKAIMEAGILSEITGEKIDSLSLHNPSVHNQYPMFGKFINAYDPKFFADDCYISDSRMQFRGKNILEFINNIEKGSVQITLHPVHYGDRDQNYKKEMIKHVENYIEEIDRNFQVNSTYLEHTKPSLSSHFYKK